jgi:hypothetical protein
MKKPIGWLRKDSVYQSIMSGALLIVFLAALSSSHWPQLSVVAGLITAVTVGIVVVVYYWVVVVCGDDDRTNAERQQDVSAKQQTEKEQKPVTETHREPQHHGIIERYEALLKMQGRNVIVPSLEQDAFVWDIKGAREEWVASRADVWLRYTRNWLAYEQAHHDSHLIAGARLKSHRRAYAAARTLGITAGEDETNEKVVVTVGSVRIEIQEDDPNKTTTVHITSPKTIVTKVAVQNPRDDRQNPEPVSQSKPSATVH